MFHWTKEPVIFGQFKSWTKLETTQAQKNEMHKATNLRKSIPANFITKVIFPTTQRAGTSDCDIHPWEYHFHHETKCPGSLKLEAAMNSTRPCRCPHRAVPWASNSTQMKSGNPPIKKINNRSTGLKVFMLVKQHTWSSLETSSSSNGPSYWKKDILPKHVRSSKK